MTLLKEIAAELIGMFFGDARLTLAILLIVAVSGALIELTAIDPVIGGGVLALACPLVLVANLRQETRGIASMKRSAA
jgi:hypothetical protein